LTIEELKPHLEELRARLLRIVFIFFVVWLGAFFYWKEIFNIIVLPIFNAMKDIPNSELIATAPAEGVTVAIKIATFSAFVIAFPSILYHSWQFIMPALMKEEKDAVKKLLYPFIISGTGMFLMGASFAYFIVFPIIFKVLLTFGADFFTSKVTVLKYLNFFFNVLIGFGISYELPVVCYYLGKFRLITSQDLIGFGRYAIVIIFIAAAILTPPDLLSQFLMAVPMLLLYGISILILKMMEWKEEKGK